MKVKLTTLGCKLNKYESDCMANLLLKAGYEITHDDFADIYIVNTCAVTQESEKKSRQYIAKCNKINPNCKIIICGCASQNNPDQFKDKKNVFSIIGNEGKENIVDLIKKSTCEVYEFPTAYNDLGDPYITTTRAYIKIQDGCNRFCTYCLIPYLRGRSRSRAIAECVEEATKLSHISKEIVVTGIDMSDFKPSLGELFNNLQDVDVRIRIGSLEESVVTEELLQSLQKLPKFCPHFHLSLQSGSDSVLKRMNRHYSTAQYLEKVELIRKYFPLANITTDIIVGFAEETEDEFKATCDFVGKVGFGQVHIFPYSRRKGTTADKLYKTDLSMSIKKERVDILEKIALTSREKYLNSLLGKSFNVLTEDEEDGFTVGYTENYVKVYLPKSTKKNTIINIKLKEIFKDGVKGE